MTTLCGSLSLHPVALGALMHRAGYAALGLDYAYVPFAMTRERLAAALAGARALGIRGLGVSMPFKLDVLPLLDELSEGARAIGAVNTIVLEQGRLIGHNTDALGAARALEELAPLPGLRVLVVGAGGAGRAVAHGLCDAGARVGLYNRTPARAAELVEQLRRRFGAQAAEPLTQLDPAGWPALVNASSCGMEGYPTNPLVELALEPGQCVMDIVYRPLDTPWVQRARRMGCRVAHGGRMLLHQAAAQFELYTGHPAPLAALEAAQERYLRAQP